MEIHYQLSANDLATLRQHVQESIKVQTSMQRLRIWGWSFIAGLLVSFLPKVFHTSENPYGQATWWLVVLAYLASIFWVGKWWRSKKALQWMEQFTGDYELVLSPAGISVCGPSRSVAFHAWPEIVAFEVRNDYLFVYLRRDVVIMIPRNGLEANDVLSDEIRRLWCAHPDNAGGSLPAIPQPVRFFPLAKIWANLREATRVVFFRRFNPHAFRVSYGQLLWLLVLWLLLLGTVDYVDALPKPEFNLYGFSMYGLSFLLTLLAAMLISSALVNRASMLRLLVMIVASGLIVDLFYLPFYSGMSRAAFDHSGWLWGLYVFATLWIFAAVFRIVGQLYRQPAPSAMYLVTLYALLTLAVGGQLPPNNRMYYNHEPEDESSAYSRARKLDVEDVMYRQPELVGAALADIRAQRPGKTDLYFVGFAGQAEEKVFGNEVHFAWGLLDRRFGTEGRSLALVNGVDTVAATPLANSHNLEAVLQGVAKRMNRDEDVLFLYLSSHGAKNHSLSVSFWPMELNDLKAEKLKTMLDKSGIRNRVIVVSACYSGGFLDVLKDDDTLVITASSRDHVSYGCGDATQYTYFGEAYFVKSLLHHDSFITAFDDARRLIETREKSEGKESSGPQIHIGKNIQRKLEQLEVKPEVKLSQLSP